MARVSGPLMSFDAAGKVADSIVFSKWKGRNYVRQFFVPSNPNTAKQQTVRTCIKLLVPVWQGLGTTPKTNWNEAAKNFQMSGFNLFVKRGMAAYFSQHTIDDTPSAVSVSGNYPSETWTWDVV